MPERRGHEPVTGLMNDTAPAAADLARLPFEVPEGLGNGVLVRVADTVRALTVADAEHQAHALRCPERQIESSDGAMRDRLTEKVAAGGVLSSQQPPDMLG